jgi:hypothetical protein
MNRNKKIRFKITFILNYTNYENERENDRNAMSREKGLNAMESITSSCFTLCIMITTRVICKGFEWYG